MDELFESSIPLRVSFADHALEHAIEQAQRLRTELEQAIEILTRVTQLMHALEDEGQQEKQEVVTPSSAVYAFYAFLMSQDPPVSFGRGCQVRTSMSLAGQFCQLQGWAPPPEGFSQSIKPWKPTTP